MAESKECKQEQFICPICLDILKRPVTIPCGHSYCLNCITDCWDQKNQSVPYLCPQCRESFSERPLLKKNTLLAEIVENLQMTPSCPQENPAVDCDVCTGEKNKAVMSCLQCLASFCETHLQPHYESPAFMKHKLVQATTQVQENICLRHGKLLEIYCQDDSLCVCYLCMIDDHKGHTVVSVESEWTNKKKALQKTKMTFAKMFQKQERGQQELSDAMKSFKSSAQEAVENSDNVFSDLICCLEKKRNEFKELIRAQEEAEMNRAEDLQKQLDQNLSELRQREMEIDKLLATDDQVHFLKGFQSVCVVPIIVNLPSFTQRTSFKDISVSALKELLEDVCLKEKEKISREVLSVQVVPLPEPKVKSEFLKYFCDLHFDANTAHNGLMLSDGNKTVSNVNEDQNYLDHPERFDVYNNVMCREGLSGRCYWEVECRGDNWSVAVSYKGINRKGSSYDCRLGCNKKSWRLGFNGMVFSYIHDKVQVCVPSAFKIGVYLNQTAGVLEFYSISKAMTLLHRVQTSFTEPLYAAFGVTAGSAVTILKKEKIQNDK